MGTNLCQAAIITPAGTAAIGSILIGGGGAKEILQSVFQPRFPEDASLDCGRMFVGSIRDNDNTIDQVVIGCEGRERFAIHGHGNPLLVESILELLVKRGAIPVSAEALLQNQILTDESNSIAAEAKITRLKAVTMEGFRLVSNQINGGLTCWAREWVGRGDTISISEVHEQSQQILADSRIARRIIHGCRAAIVGPPNSGKSTLFNRLCGADKSIVAEIGGTTRDWVGSIWRVPSLRVELIDTAGLADDLAAADPLQAASQQRTRDMIGGADFLIVVLDGSRPPYHLIQPVARDRPVIVVINKSDQPQVLDRNNLSFPFAEIVTLSAQTGLGVDTLLTALRRVAGVDGFDLDRPVCLTSRQISLIAKLAECNDPRQIVNLFEQLLKGLSPV